MRITVPLHVAFDLVWIGSIAAVGLLLAKGPGDSRSRGVAALTVYRTLSVPAFIGAFVLGLIALGRDVDLYFKHTRFMHAKLLLALFVIGLHHALGARARKMAEGSVDGEGPAWLLAQVLVGLAGVVTYLAVAKPF
ncbi:MAG: CopD family protein [Polyangiaceae bacterium]|nr:CopD family protein [Polyangiaceae bacterium]